MPFGFVRENHDDFDNGSVGWTSTNDGTQISEAGTIQTVVNQDGETWGVFTNSLATIGRYLGWQANLSPTRLYRAELAITEFTPTTSPCYAGFIGNDITGNPRSWFAGLYWNGSTYYRHIYTVAVSSFVTRHNSVAASLPSASVPWIIRFYWNGGNWTQGPVTLPEDSLVLNDTALNRWNFVFYFSLDGGSTWSRLFTSLDSSTNYISGNPSHPGVIVHGQPNSIPGSGGAGTLKIDWISSYRWLNDTTPPDVVNEDPAPSATGVDRLKVLELDITDASSIDLSTVLIEIQRTAGGPWETAYTGSTDTFSAPYDGGSSSQALIGTGYRFNIDYTGNWVSGETMSVRASADDTAGNSMTNETYSFTIDAYDVLAPLLTPIDPTASQINVSRETHITLRITDDFKIVASSVVVEVDRGSGFETAYTSGSFQAGWNGAASNAVVTDTQIDIVLDPEVDLPGGQVVSVRVTAEDESGKQVIL